VSKKRASISAAIICASFLMAATSVAAATPGDFGIIIKKKDISATATFIPYSYNGLMMEVIAVKASDGTIRTALNTCQICYQSGRGYYKQDGGVFVCQNCGNRFAVDQVELIKGGCNPVPILGDDKTDLGATIGISKQYLAKVSPYFRVWKKNVSN
jgi:Membrane iron-sulfur containing protein FtrD-like